MQQLGEDESYHLEISKTRVQLTAPNPLGVLHGLQTFLQLVKITPQGFSIPVATIDDKPRFPWRGLMIDVSRHFSPIPVIERNLDGMEAAKLNVFHWHLSDDQGFRAESKKFPLLQGKGSDGLYYTQAQIRQVIQYARDRGIRVVPEFDMPCHTTAWFIGYSQLASGKGPYHIARHWGIHNAAMDPARESTYQFLNQFIGEMAALFPDDYFDVGGDECNGKEWDANPQIQAFMHAHIMRNNAALQSYFIARIQKLVTAHHKIMEVWHEPNTPKNVVIESWRGQGNLADAARRGYRGLLAFGYYLDLNTSAADLYSVDPMGKDRTTLSSVEMHRILGGEATMWSEFVTPENIDSRIWPRTAAIAERLWSPQDVQDVNSMYARLALFSQKLEYYGLENRTSYGEMLRRMTGDPNPVSLRVLGDVVEPPKLYARWSLGSYNSFTPLNRLVDAVPPESDTARHFLDLVNDIVSRNATPQQWQQAQQWLRLWRDNDSQLQPLLSKSDLTQDLIPLSTNLHQVAEVGLEAIDLLHNGRLATAKWRNQQLVFLKASEQPQAVLLNMIAPAVEKLLQATKQQ